MKSHLNLDYADAGRIEAACAALSLEIGVPVSLAVLDAAGHTLLLARFDGAQFQTPEVARGKALTAVMMRKPSGDIEKATLSRLTLATFDDGRLPIQGALPVMSGTDCVGAIGISGGTPDQDESIARAGLEALSALSIRERDMWGGSPPAR